MKEITKIALLGQPNSGKSSVFNVLTGSHQHTGNWPGKTVEKKEGTFEYNGNKFQIADLPGAYSLSANSEEEIVTRDYVTNGDVDLALVLVDASQMERSMFMLADYAGITTPLMVVLTMTDVAQQQGKKIDIEKLSEKLGVPVAGIVAPEKKSYDSFFKTLDEAVRNPKVFDGSAIFDGLAASQNCDLYKAALNLVPSEGFGRTSKEWAAAKLMEQDEVVVAKVSSKGNAAAVKEFAGKAKNGGLITSECKFDYIEKLISTCVTKAKSESSFLTKFDRLAISKRWGKLVSFGVVLLGIICTCLVALPVMGLGSGISSLLSKLVVDGLGSLGVSESITTFINSTLITTISWVLSMSGFVFGVNFVFGLIEEMGYMARISYTFDGTMNKLGLQGKSIMPMVISLGCTIGGAAGTRVVDSWGQRILTIAVLWAIPCGATFAVIPTLSVSFFGPVGGILVFLLIFAIMILHMWVTSKIFGRKLNPVQERTGLIMELPPYHKPRWGLVFKNTLRQMWNAFKKAFGVVLIITVVFYFLAYSADGVAEKSILYKIGSAIEPVTKFFGMGWQCFIAFVSSMVSKEAVLGVFSAIYANTGTIFSTTTKMVAHDANITQVMAQVISKPEALAFMIAVNFNVPCLMAIASTYQECHSMKWTLKIAGYYIATALLISCVVYHIAVLFF